MDVLILPKIEINGKYTFFHASFHEDATMRVLNNFAGE